MPELSRAFAVKLIEQGKVRVNDAVVAKPGYKLAVGDGVKIDYDLAAVGRVPEIDMPVLYEDEDCVVIDKPAGVLVHSKGGFNPEATVATWLRSRLRDEAADSVNNRAGIVHRLDRATSGVMLCAKSQVALSWLQKQFAQRKVKKTYVAVVQGKLDHAEAVIDMPIERNPKHPQTFRVGSHGKPATTAYETLQHAHGLSLVELRPTTGRTHQLRVHLAQLGHPILGDTLYGGMVAERLFLHAVSLEITLLDRQRKVFSSPLPAEFKVILAHETADHTA